VAVVAEATGSQSCHAKHLGFFGLPIPTITKKKSTKATVKYPGAPESINPGTGIMLDAAVGKLVGICCLRPFVRCSTTARSFASPNNNQNQAHGKKEPSAPVNVNRNRHQRDWPKRVSRFTGKFLHR
jgi:hypothetical protein